MDGTLAGNEAWRWMAFFAAVLLALIAGKLVRMIMESAAGRYVRIGREGQSVLLKAMARSMPLMSLAAGFWVGVSLLRLPPRLADLIRMTTGMLTSAAAGFAVYNLVDLVDYLFSRGARRTASKIDRMLAPLVGRSLRITVVAVVILQMAQALSDKPIAAIVTSLGVGGLAIALAAQDTIKNVFGSLVIIADKPFEIGDRVVIGGHDGPVESVGFRSTRIRTLDGHLVTVPNSDVASMMVQNIGKRPYIRHVANIAITYDTPPGKVDRAVAILRERLADHEGMHPDFPPRVFFNEFKDSSLNLQVVYWYHPPDYWRYMAFNERFNRDVLRRFNDEGIDFAFPTQTIHLAGDGPSPRGLS